MVGLDNFDYPSAEEDTTEQLTESLIVCLEKNTESLFFQTKRKKIELVTRPDGDQKMVTGDLDASLANLTSNLNLTSGHGK